jgi:hypothetical protein
MGPALARQGHKRLLRVPIRLRGAVLGPRGGQDLARSPVRRIGFAIAGAAVSIPVIRTGRGSGLDIVRAWIGRRRRSGGGPEDGHRVVHLVSVTTRWKRMTGRRRCTRCAR